MCSNVICHRPPDQQLLPRSYFLFLTRLPGGFFLRGDEQPMCFADGEGTVEVNGLSKVIDQVNHIWLGSGSIMAVCPVSSSAGLSLPVLGRIPNWVIWYTPAGRKLPLWFCTHLVIFHFSLWHVLSSYCCCSRKMSEAPRSTANSARGGQCASQQGFQK